MDVVKNMKNDFRALEKSGGRFSNACKMKRKAVFVLIIFFITLPCNADDDIDYLLSLDISYALSNLPKQGWGIGVNYEKRLFNHLSVKGNFGHMTFLTGIKDVYCTSVHLSAFVNYYPMGNGLDKSYIGIGIGSDFMNYFGKGEKPDNNEDILVHLTPQTGWKFLVLPYLMIDVSVGYKFIIAGTQNYDEISKYVHPGVRFGLNFYLFFSRLQREGWKTTK